MALGTTGINIALIKSTLGDSHNNLGGLCTSNNINMWSRYKPVNGTWPQATDGKYGLALPTSTSGGAYSVSNWTYNKASSDYSLGDFRGYEHGYIYPPIYSKNSGNVCPATLYPSGTYYLATFSVFGNSTNSTTRIQPSDLGLSSYYLGIRYRINAGFWYYKTVSTQVSSLVETGSSSTPLINVAVTVTGGNPSFADCPVTTTGSAEIELILCSSQCSSWTTTAPTTVIKLPSVTVNGDVLSNYYAVTIAEWTVLSTYNLVWANNNTTYQASTLYCSVANWYVIDKPAWLNLAVYRGGNLVTAGGYINGDEIRLTPSGINSGDNRSGAVNVSSNSITVLQYGHNPNLLGYSATGAVVSLGTAILSINATSSYCTFHINSGLGGTNVPIWIRMFNNSDSYYMGSWQTTNTRDGQNVTITLGTFSSADIRYGGDYTVYVTNIDPNL